MKKMHRARDFLAGVFVAALVVSLSVPAMAALSSKTIQVSTGVDIYVDGVKMIPTDANGNPVETFVYNGTTYVPLRAVSQSLGKAVEWDGINQRVYIGEVPGQKQYLLDVCPPYQTKNYEQPTTITMAGVKYVKGFYLLNRTTFDGYAFYNLNGQYNSFSFDIGHIDGTDMQAGTIRIYLDGDLAFELDLDPEMMPQHCTVPLRGALQMKIEQERWGQCYGIVNAEIS